MAESQPRRGGPARIRATASPSRLHEERQGQRRDDPVAHLFGGAALEADAPHGAALDSSPATARARPNRSRRQRGGERVHDLAVAAARIQKAAVDVLGLRAGKDELVEERSQRHALEPPRGDVRRELVGRKPPELRRVVQQDAARERSAEAADGEVLEAHDRLAPPEVERSRSRQMRLASRKP